MKQLHINHFNSNMYKSESRLRFIQSEKEQFGSVAKPKNVPSDFPTSFLQTSEESKIQPLLLKLEKLETFNCWASSRWEYAYQYSCDVWVQKLVETQGAQQKTLVPFANTCLDIIFSSYPCNTQIGNKGNWFWLSEQLQDEAILKEITFKVEFDMIRRIKKHYIIFLAAPQFIKIDSSQDLIHWEQVQEYEETIQSQTMYPFYYTSQKDYSPILYSKGLRLTLKGLHHNIQSNRHGIWQLDFYSQDQTVMILEKSARKVPRCVARSEAGFYQSGVPLILMNCLDAILQNDSREVFFLEGFFLKQYTDKMCLTPFKHSDGETFITTQKCEDKDLFKYIIDKLGKVSLKSSPALCLSSSPSSLVSLLQPFGHLSTSSSLSDSRCNPYNTIDPNASGWWGASVGSQSASWEIQWDRRYLVESVEVLWKWRPKRVAVKVLVGQGEANVWVAVKEGLCQGDLLVQMVPTEILGVQVLMLELDEDLQNEFRKPLFGIQKVSIKRPGTPVSVQTCAYQGLDSKIINRFKFEDVEFIDTSFLIPHIQSTDFLNAVYSQTKSMVQQVMIQVPMFKLILKYSEDIASAIKSINRQIEQVFTQLAPYKKLLTEYTYSPICLGCSQQTPAQNCIQLKQRNFERQNGYFWIKAKCMPSAERVYCDFQFGDSNFYYYNGFLKQQSKTLNLDSIKKLQAHCKQIGLEPVEIKFQDQINQIIDYLNEIDANSEDSIGIPIAIRYDIKEKEEKFQSLNSQDSLDVTKFLENHMNQQDQMEKMNSLDTDMIILKNSKNKLSNDFIEKAKIRGLVCSQNFGLKQKSSQHDSFAANCDSTLSLLNPHLNTIYKISCPSSCGIKKQFLIQGGKSVYSEESSLCRAGVHFGAIGDQGGEFQIKVVKGLKSYQASEENQVVSLSGSGKEGDKGFEIIMENIFELCPNLKPKINSFLSFQEIINKVKQNKVNSLNQISEEQSEYNQSLLQIQEQSYLDLEIQSENVDLPMDLAQAKTYINEALKRKTSHFKDYLNFIKDVFELQKQNEKLIASIFGSTLHPQNQKQNLEITKLRIQATESVVQDLVRKGESKLSTHMKKYLKNVNDHSYLKRFDSYQEDYSEELKNIYEIMDSKQPLGDQSHWEFTTENTHPHKSAILQSSQISCNSDFSTPDSDCTATMMILKYRKFYDYQVKLDFKVGSQGFFGLVFRYNLQLTIQQNTFKLHLQKETQFLNPQKYDNMPLILSSEDQFLKSGFTGLLSDSTLNLLFDSFQIKPLDCWNDKFDSGEVVKHKQPFASRFRETYKSDIKLVWKYDYAKAAQWEYRKSAFKRKQVLLRKRKIADLQFEPIVLQEKILKQGWVRFDFYKEKHESQIQFIFLYSDENNFSYLLIDEDKVQVFEVDNQIPTTIVTQLREDIQVKTWYSVFFQMSENIVIWIEDCQINSQRIQLFGKEVDKPASHKNYFIGFNVYKGSAAFDNIVLSPGKVPEKLFIKQNDQKQPQKLAEQPTVQPQSSILKVGSSDAESSDKIDYSECLAKNSKQKQQKYCSQRFPSQFSLILECSSNFCLSCCSSLVPPLAFWQLNRKCQSECQPLLPDRTEQWRTCVWPIDPKNSLYAFCQSQFPRPLQKKQKNDCQMGFCEMCCNLQPVILDINMFEDQLQHCAEMCKQTYNK